MITPSDVRRDGLHVIQVSDLALLVGNDGEGDLATSDLVDISDPSLVAAEGVGG